MENLETGQSPHLLPTLPYHHAALEPYIDAQTMMLHHGKHHASYVANLNAALEKFPELQKRNVLWLLLNQNKIPQKIRDAVCNNAGGHVNHSLFWRAMSPQASNKPAGPLAEAIDRDFGNFEKFKHQFVETGEKLFGSGWVWLVRAQQDGGKLQICTTTGHDNPMTQGHFPVLLNDVWEHAYYLKYENRRGDYLNNWWAIANWEEAARRFEQSDHSAENNWEDEGGHLMRSST
jgi:superoxide dismutase, Fe-Mn family